MGRRDVLFLALILGGAAAITWNLAPSRGRAAKLAPVAPVVDDLREVVGRVDRSLRDRSSARGIVHARRAPDLAILRRLTLALAGSVPSLEEIRRFEAMPVEGRLERWVETMLGDRRTADYLAERLARAFVGVEDGPFIIFRRRRFVTWLSEELIKNRPYDQVVTELIAGEGLWTDRPATNFITVTMDSEPRHADPERLAARFARAFLATRIDCAQCHDHPFQPWKRADFRGIAAYFGQIRHGFGGVGDDAEGAFRVDDRKDGHAVAVEPRPPFLPGLDPKAGTRRQRLARWLTDRRNPALGRATVNRAWALMFGRPLVEPVDDLAAAPELPEALTILADDFAANGYNLGRLIRTIAATEAFRLDSAVESESETDPNDWSAFPLTRLRPEQVAGALLQSGSAETIDAGSHILVRLATQGGVNDFVRRHGDPGEDEFALETSSTIPQRLLMMNGDLVQGRIKPDLNNLSTRISLLAPDDRTAVEVAYLTILTRRPTPAEAAHFEGRLAGALGDERKERLTDLAWTLLNATEFSWNH